MTDDTTEQKQITAPVAPPTTGDEIVARVAEAAQSGQKFPLCGFWWTVRGITPDGHLVLTPAGRTGGDAKRRARPAPGDPKVSRRARRRGAMRNK